MEILIKESIYLGLAYSFRGLVRYYHGGKHGSIQIHMVLGKKLKVLHPDSGSKKREKH